MFIGEAPGLSEDSLGKPFVGPAGKLLDHIIANALQPFEDRYTFAFMNLVGCVPKDETQKKMGAPPDWVIEKCWPRLEELIAIAEPSILIAVGQLAEEWLEVDVRITHPSFILSKLGPSQRPLAIQKATYVIEDVVNHILNPPF
jgi:DNA polymerase